jgi:hypothetical protein
MTDRSAVFETQRYKRGRIEGDKLTRALIDAASRGLRSNCSQPEVKHLCTSEYDSDRAIAALACHGCVVWAECGEAAEARQETWGVWQAKDYSRRPGRPRPQAE